MSSTIEHDLDLSSDDPELVAAREALEGARWQEALDRFSALSESRPDSAAVLEGLGWAAFWLQQGERSLEAREKAYSLYLKQDDTRQAGRVALGILSANGEGLGTCWGEEKALEMLSEAGFSRTEAHRFPDNFFHSFYISRP